MEENKIIEYAKKLTKITIKKHNDKLLGKEKMSSFLKKNINNEINSNDYNNILHLYSRYLASSGYEIINDIEHFDVINYNTEEYYIYRDNLQNNK